MGECRGWCHPELTIRDHNVVPGFHFGYPAEHLNHSYLKMSYIFSNLAKIESGR